MDPLVDKAGEARCSYAILSAPQLFCLQRFIVFSPSLSFTELGVRDADDSW